MSLIKNYIVHNVAPRMPSKICTQIYKKCGLINCDNVRNGTYIQNIEALKIGKNVFINKFCKILNGYDSDNKESHVVICDNVTIGFGTTIITSTHAIGGANYRADFREINYKPVLIGSGTWICANCVINPGVKIGEGCVIASGSVVVEDCTANCLYGGNPAKLIKNL